MDTIQTLLWTILVGMASGIATAVVGFLKSIAIEKFDNEKFLTTVIWGACVGILMGYYGWPYAQGYQFLVSMGFVTVIDQSAKVIYRRIAAWWATRKITTTTIMKKASKPKKKKPAKDEEEDSDELKSDVISTAPLSTPPIYASIKEEEDAEDAKRKARVAELKAKYRAKMDAKAKEESSK